MTSLGARVCAVIVHYQTPAETVRAAEAVARFAPELPILVVDNASRDGIAERLAGSVPAARVLAEDQNRGYGAACNRAARETDAEFLLLLNSDAYLEPGAVESLLAALDEDPAAAAVGPRLSDPAGGLQESIRRLPTPWKIFCESSGLAALAGGRGVFRGHTKTREDHSRAQAVEALMGAALLVRRSAFERVGGFDEGYFLYAEETDLFRRLRDCGDRILFEPRSRVIHVGGASSGDRLFARLHASLERYAGKFHGPAAARFARAILICGAAARYLVALATPGEGGRKRRNRYRAALSAPRAVRAITPRSWPGAP